MRGLFGGFWRLRRLNLRQVSGRRGRKAYVEDAKGIPNFFDAVFTEKLTNVTVIWSYNAINYIVFANAKQIKKSNSQTVFANI